MSESQEQKPVFSIEKLYTKDISLEVPNAPQVFLESAQPEIEMHLSTEGKQIDEGFFHVTLVVTVVAKLLEKTAFLVEISQAGIFQIRHLPIADLDPVLGVACPNILFPYAREAVSNLVGRAGFPPVLLTPVNFEALYMEQRAQQATAGNA